MHARVAMFLRERDRARVRGDFGVERSLTADLLRLGVPPEATLVDPTGKHSNGHHDGEPAKRGRGRPPKPRCEHGNLVERCHECNPETLVD